LRRLPWLSWLRLAWLQVRRLRWLRRLLHQLGTVPRLLTACGIPVSRRLSASRSRALDPVDRSGKPFS